MSKKVFCTVGVDLGATNTGLFHTMWHEGQEDIQASSAVIIADSQKKTWLQESRRIKRHQRRNIKRRKLAKRLLRVLLEQSYGVDYTKTIAINRTVGQKINGMLNRRGFTFITEQIDPDLVENLDIEVRRSLSPPLNEIFAPESGSVEQSISKFLSDVTKVKDLNLPLLNHSKKTLKKSKEFEVEMARIKVESSSGIKEIEKRLVDVIVHFSELVKDAKNAHTKGQRHRSQYFREIDNDLGQDLALKAYLKEKNVDLKEFINIVCHISNLQIGPLRRYFSNSEYKTQDQIDWVRVQKILNRWFTAWHPNGDEEVRGRRLLCLSKLRELGAARFFKEVDPGLTIPPFEDMNNRRPPKCQSLILKPETAEKYPVQKWNLILMNLLLKNHPRAYNLVNESQNEVQKLQILLDLSFKLDHFKLRKVASDDTCEESSALKGAFGGMTDSFLAFIKVYFSEIKTIQTGIASSELSSLIRVCKGNPPQKRNIWSEHLERILLPRIPETRRPGIKEIKVWLETGKLGRKSIKAHLEQCSDLVKSYGNGLKARISKILWKKEQDIKLDGEEVSLHDVANRAQEFAEAFARQFSLQADEVRPFSSLWSQAQVFEIVFKEQSGFSRTCRHCTEDNKRRAQVIDIPADEGGESSFSGLAVPLAAEPNRPFDGFLGRLLDDIAKEAASHIHNKHLGALKADDELVVSIAIEENKFETQEGLVKLKKDQASSPRKAFDKEDPENIWKSKDERIKSDGKNICPYTGVVLGGQFQIDHIIPRWWSKKNMDTTFDSEINLIAVSVVGNQNKGAQVYALNHLNEKWLKANFGDSNHQKLKARAEDFYDSRFKMGAISDVSRLTAEERNLLRLCLFIDDSKRKEIIRAFGSRRATIVNGTQAYFINRLCERLLSKVKNGAGVKKVSVRASRVDAQLVSQCRRSYAVENKAFEKKSPQPIASHVIDAAVTWQLGLHQLGDALSLASANLDSDKLLSLIREGGVDIVEIMGTAFSKKTNMWGHSLFKDSHYAERFLPVIKEKDGGVYVGFSKENSLPVKGNAGEFLEKIKPWCKQNSFSNGTSYTVNKALLFKDLHSGRLSPDIWQIFSSIRYFQKRQNVLANFVDIKKNKVEIEKVFEDKNFVVKVAGFPRGQTFQIQTGKVFIPAKRHWERVVQSPEFKNWHAKEKPDVSDEHMVSFLKETLFPEVSRESRQHRKVRQNVFLPMIDNPSGGIRHMRRDSLGNPLFQIKVAHVKGIGVIQKNNNFDDIFYHQVFGTSGLVPAEMGSPVKERDKNYLPLHEWREIKFDGLNAKVLMCISESTPRMSVRIRAPLTILKKLGVPIDQNVFELHREIKNIEIQEQYKDMLGKPRGLNGKVVSLGDICCIEYVSESATSSMKTFYLNGEKCSI